MCCPRKDINSGLPYPQYVAKKEDSVRTDCAISRTFEPGVSQTRLISGGDDRRGERDYVGLDNSRHAGFFSLNGLSRAGNSRPADAYFSSIRDTASERALTRCRRCYVFGVEASSGTDQKADKGGE